MGVEHVFRGWNAARVSAGGGERGGLPSGGKFEIGDDFGRKMTSKSSE